MTIQVQQPTAPSPPALPSQPPIGAVTTINGVPQSIMEVRALRGQRAELSNQLQSAQGRRDDVVQQLKEASPAERPGLEARLKQLDEQILGIEGEISRTGELIAQTPGNLLSTGTSEPTIGGMRVTQLDMTAISIVFTLFVLAPVAFTVARLIWKRTSSPAPQRVDAQAEDRMRRLEAGVDAIALEVERISEGQRFVTKLLSDRDKQSVLRGDS